MTAPPLIPTAAQIAAELIGRVRTTPTTTEIMIPMKNGCKFVAHPINVPSESQIVLKTGASTIAHPTPTIIVTAGVLDGSISMEVWNGLALAGGAATVGCCCNMLGFAVISYPDNGVGGLVAQGLGTSMLQVPNLMRKPVLWIPPVLTSAILGPVATCIFQLRNNGAAISSGMGTAGLVGPIGIITGWSNMPKGYAPGAFDWVGMILVCFILPVVLSWAIGKFMRKKGWIKEGDLKVDLG